MATTKELSLKYQLKPCHLSAQLPHSSLDTQTRGALAEKSHKSEERHLGGVICHKQEPFCVRMCGGETTERTPVQEEVEVAFMASQGPDFMF